MQTLFAHYLHSWRWNPWHCSCNGFWTNAHFRLRSFRSYVKWFYLCIKILDCKRWWMFTGRNKSIVLLTGTECHTEDLAIRPYETRSIYAFWASSIYAFWASSTSRRSRRWDIEGTVIFSYDGSALLAEMLITKWKCCYYLCHEQTHEMSCFRIVQQRALLK